MKADHMVKINGVFYKPGDELPKKTKSGTKDTEKAKTPETPEETSK
jgi:hypothetical protein